EAYFEVAHHESKPFHAIVNKAVEITVLGTHFNINAYQDDERITTTLIEGKVRVNRIPRTEFAQTNAAKINNEKSTTSTVKGMQKYADEIILSPGNQVQINPATADQKLIKDADVSKAIAWKNGAFNFDGLTLREVMHQLERWSNIQVEFRGSASNRIIGGEMDRNLKLNDVLEILGKINV